MKKEKIKLLILDEKFKSLKEQTEKVKDEIMSEVNKIIKPMYGKTVNSWNEVAINLRRIEEDCGLNYFTGMTGLEVWETNSENEYARSYFIPLEFFKFKTDKQIFDAYKKIEEDFLKRSKKNEEEQRKKRQEIEYQMYLKLKKKYKNKK